MKISQQANQIELMDYNNFELTPPISQINDIDNFLFNNDNISFYEEDLSISTKNNSEQSIDKEDISYSTLDYQEDCNKRTSNTTLKPIFTCTKRILQKLDNQFSGFFKKFMPRNQNTVKKQYFQFFISYAQFNQISLKGLKTDLKYVFDKYRMDFNKLIKRQINKKQIKKSKQTQKFINLLYKALESNDYVQRMKILFSGRKHDLTALQLKRSEFNPHSN